MGTSSARRGPTTGLWRSAKGAATRYLSPGAGGEVSAREVVVRYLAALAETPGQGDRLAAFRVTRKVGQDLGAFCQEVEVRGWGLALKDRGLAPPAQGPAELLVPAVAGELAGNGGGLEEAVVRTARALVLWEAMQSQERLATAQVVRRFLAAAVHLRLALDLGEPAAGACGYCYPCLMRRAALHAVGWDRGEDHRRGVLSDPATLTHPVRGLDLRALLVAVSNWEEAPAEIEARLMLGAAPETFPARLAAARLLLDRGFREIAGWLRDKGPEWVQGYMS